MKSNDRDEDEYVFVNFPTATDLNQETTSVQTPNNNFILEGSVITQEESDDDDDDDDEVAENEIEETITETEEEEEEEINQRNPVIKLFQALKNTIMTAYYDANREHADYGNNEQDHPPTAVVPAYSSFRSNNSRINLRELTVTTPAVSSHSTDEISDLYTKLRG